MISIDSDKFGARRTCFAGMFMEFANILEMFSACYQHSLGIALACLRPASPVTDMFLVYAHIVIVAKEIVWSLFSLFFKMLLLSFICFIYPCVVRHRFNFF